MRSSSRLRMSEFISLVAADLLAVQGKRSLSGMLMKLYVDPGFFAVFKYRLSVLLLGRGVVGRFLSKILWKSLVKSNSCYLSPRSSIEGGLCLPHAVGIVVGDGVKIGRDVTIFQNVTLGVGGESDSSYPEISDRVIVYAGACVVGGVSIGRDARVGANAVVVRNVLDCETVVGVPARPLPSRA